MRSQTKRRLKCAAAKGSESAILAVAEFFVRFTIGFIATIVQASIRWPMFGAFIIILIALDVLSHHPIVLGITFVVMVIIWLITRSSEQDESSN